MSRVIKICFISLNSYPLFQSRSKGYFGGAELQISLLIKQLVKNKHFRVSLITGDYGQPQVVKSKSLTIYKCYRPKILGLWEAFFFLKTLKEINADIYVERTMNVKVGLVSLFCRLFGKKFIYMVSHDWDTNWQFKTYLQGLTKWWYFLGLKLADMIVAQTQTQQKNLKRNFNLDSIIMPSLLPPTLTRIKVQKKFVLWVGRADKWKRPEIFIDLAKKLPKENFIMICRQGNDRNFFARIKNLAQQQTNLEFFPAMSIEDIVNYFQKAKIFVNTSVAEGFPNTFLQAGLAKTPVVSLTVNPDSYIDRYHCGTYVNNDFSRLVKACQNIKADWGNNNWRYVTKFHSLDKSRRFSQILLDHFSRSAA